MPCHGAKSCVREAIHESYWSASIALGASSEHGLENSDSSSSWEVRTGFKNVYTQA